MNSRKTIVFLLSVAAILCLNATGCHSSSSSEVAAPDPKSAVNRSISVVVLDANTDDLVSASLTLTVRDDDGILAADVEDTNGDSVSSFSTTNGVVTFAYAAAAAVPQTLVVIVEGSGYITSSAPVDITGDGAVNITVHLTRLADLPTGAESAADMSGSADAGGSTAAVLNVSTPPEDTTSSTMTLDATAGTTIVDGNGDPLTGDLTVTLVYYNNQDEEALQAFPGGFQVDLESNEVGAEEDDVSFVTAGFAVVEIQDENGNIATDFTPDLMLTIEIPGGTINPETGLAVAAADTIPVWSYDPENGQWQFEETGVIAGPDVDGNFSVTFGTDHLSYFALSWKSDACTDDGRVIQITGADDRPILATFRAENTGFIKTIMLLGVDVDGDVPMTSMPDDQPVQLTLELADTGVVIAGPVDIDDLCDGVDLMVPVTLPTANPATLTVTVNESCPNAPGQKTALPSAHVLTRATNGAWVFQGETNASGQLVINGLQQSVAYEVKALRGTSEETETRTLNAATGTLTVDIPLDEDCSLITGSGGSGG